MLRPCNEDEEDEEVNVYVEIIPGYGWITGMAYTVHCISMYYALPYARQGQLVFLSAL